MESYLQYLEAQLEISLFHHCIEALCQAGKANEQNKYIPSLGKCKTSHHCPQLKADRLSMNKKRYTMNNIPHNLH